LTPERWVQIEELFHRAAECEPERRTGLLDEACSDDPELRREVEALLFGEEHAGNPLHAAVRGVLHDFGFPLRGETVSHYRILDGVDSGGMGQVYRAEDIKLGRRVALKFLPQDSAKDPGALGRFEREARAASALEHPNICPIYEFGEHEGQPFLVMQLLEGQTLRELLSANGAGKAPLELNRLLELALQILDGLDAAHHQGIIHRDIKPANIFVTSQGQAKILDFGLAKLARTARLNEEDVESDPQGDGGAKETPCQSVSLATHPFLSRTGVAMGTAGYMSPEQVRGEKLDARTDLFSFGSVLYEMATGKRAFAGDTAPEFHDAILTTTPRPARELNPLLPAKLEKVIAKALEKDRDTRYQSASDMRSDLEALRLEIAPRHRAGWRALAAAGVVVLSIPSAAYWFAERSVKSSAALPAIKLHQLTSNSSENGVGSGTISPDGKYLAYMEREKIRVKRIETDETRTIPQPANLDLDTSREGFGGIGPWFPDGTKFLVASHPRALHAEETTSQGSSIWIVSVSGGPPRKIRDEAFLDSISPDGSLISFETHKGKFSDREIWVMGPEGEHARKVLEVDENSSIQGVGWSKDGQRVVFQRQDGPNPADSYFMSGDINGGPLTKIVAPFAPERMNAGLWLPDNRLIYGLVEPGFKVTTCNLFEIRMNPQLTEFIGKPQRLTNFAELCVNPMNTTADGKQVVLHQWRPHSNVYVSELQAGGRRASAPSRLTLDESWNHPLAWSVDSKTVLFSSDRAGVDQIFKQSIGAVGPESLLTFRRNEKITGACISPDGSWLIYMVVLDKGGIVITNKIMGVDVTPANPTAKNNLMRIPISGGSPQLVLTASIEEWPRCARSPSDLCAIAERSVDLKQLVFTAFDAVKGRGRELARSNVDPTTYYHWDLSPDGTRIALLKNRDNRIEILSLIGGVEQEVVAKGWDYLTSVTWTANGKGLLVSGYGERGAAMLHLDLKGNARLLWEHPSVVNIYGVPSPDGRHLAMRGWNLDTSLWLMENF
jgi:eukaryotic-like serine/threonine-protein kinase